jgi:hypothetical protein
MRRCKDIHRKGKWQVTMEAEIGVLPLQAKKCHENDGHYQKLGKSGRNPPGFNTLV